MYDLLLYLWRFTTYEIPYVGGRARGRQRPRAPSLKERPNGHVRTFSFGGAPRASGNDVTTTGPMSDSGYEDPGAAYSTSYGKAHS